MNFLKSSEEIHTKFSWTKIIPMFSTCPPFLVSRWRRCDTMSCHSLRIYFLVGSWSFKGSFLRLLNWSLDISIKSVSYEINFRRLIYWAPRQVMASFIKKFWTLQKSIGSTRQTPTKITRSSTYHETLELLRVQNLIKKSSFINGYPRILLQTVNWWYVIRSLTCATMKSIKQTFWTHWSRTSYSL